MAPNPYENHPKVEIALTIPSWPNAAPSGPLTPARGTTTPTLRKAPKAFRGVPFSDLHTTLPGGSSNITVPEENPPTEDRSSSRGGEPSPKPRGVFWTEARGQFRLAAPLVGMNLVQMTVVLSSAAFVGHLGELQLASAQLATTMGNASGHYVLMGMTLGYETLGGQAFGAGQYTEVGHMMLCCTVVLTLISGAISLLWTFSDPIFLAMGQEAELAKGAARYLLFLIPSLFAHAWSAPLVTFLQSQGVTGPLVWCAVLMLALHIPANWFFIYYLGLGLDGAALATSLAYFVMFLSLAVHIYFSKEYVKCKVWFGRRKTFKNWKPLVKLAVPSTVMLCLEYWAFDALYILCGLLPEPYLKVSALSVAMNSGWLASMLYIGLGAALSTRVSNELGSNASGKARVAARVGLTTGAALGVVTFALIMVSVRWVPLIFVDAAETKLVDLASKLMMVLSAVALGDAINQNAGGVIRGCGRQPLGASITLSSYYLIGLPVCAVLAFPLKLGIWGLVGGQVLAVTCQAACLATAVAYTDWPRQAARALASVLEVSRREPQPAANERPDASEGDQLARI